MKSKRDSLFPALIRHWRTRRGLSQLDLALSADVSARHVSFLETGRARPSREMILRLANALSVPLRDQNALLNAAGFDDAFAAPDALSGAVRDAVDRMMALHEPYPMVAMNRGYDVVRVNQGGAALLARVIADPTALAERPPNAYKLLFDPRLARPFIVDWLHTARLMLSRLHREALERAEDETLRTLVEELLAYPGVPANWQEPDLLAPSEPCLTVRVRRDELELAFLTTVTVFNAPQNVTLEELRIESYFPLDERTRQMCSAMSASTMPPVTQPP